jgi:hypothetical protein
MRPFFFVVVLLYAMTAFAEPCDIPEANGDDIPGARAYTRTHEIWEYADGKTFASDYIWVWPSRTEGNQCFLIFAMYNNLHFCQLGGEAIETKVKGRYEFKDETCYLRLKVTDKKVHATVKSREFPNDMPAELNKYCQPVDKWGCGDKTGIGSHSYRFVRANPAVQGTLRDKAAQRP